mmetsp:Transcript_25042/g.63940  ORF Transcript_25042/g.63940 Transcript_25042/m.63940 type:complete len:465 (-) Transcript_25042:47-1441(-)
MRLLFAVLYLSRAAASSLLSEHFVKGLWILQAIPGHAGDFKVYPGGQKGKPKRLRHALVTSFKQFRARLAKALKLPPREPLQNDWGLYFYGGVPVESLEDAVNATQMFVWEIGHWMWPAVRVGFEQRVSHPSFPAGEDGGDLVLRTLAVRPAVFEIRGFLRPEECERIISLADSEMVASGLVGNDGAALGRTSSQAWLYNHRDPLVAQLDERTAQLVKVPALNNERLQVLRYRADEFYSTHFDWVEMSMYPDNEKVWRKCHYGHYDRMATVFWYLRTIEDGGQTAFPKAGGAPDPENKLACSGLQVKPEKGKVIMWYNLHGDGSGDRDAMHLACHVGKNSTEEKWAANKWVMTKPSNLAPAGRMDHPALARHGLKLSEQAPAEAAQPRLSFVNELDHPVEILYVDGTNFLKATDLAPGKASTLNAGLGASFLAQSERLGRSTVVTISQPEEVVPISLGMFRQEL